MGDLIPRSRFGMSPSEIGYTRVQRQVDQAIAIEQSKARLRQTHEQGRIETVARVTELAVAATAHISAVESLLITQAPHAEQRLRNYWRRSTP